MRFIRFFFFYCFILLMYVCVRLITLDVDFFFYLLETGDEQLQILYYKISYTYFHLFYLTTVRLDRIYLTHTNLSFTTVNFLLLFYCLKIKSSSRLMVVVRIKF